MLQSTEQTMQKQSEQLFTAELAELWSTAQHHRDASLAVWCCGLRDRLRAALAPKVVQFERRIAAHMGSKLAVESEVRQGA